MPPAASDFVPGVWLFLLSRSESMRLRAAGSRAIERPQALPVGRTGQGFAAALLRTPALPDNTAPLPAADRRMSSHPCLRCGACCAFFRVAFHWSETDACAGGLTPQGLTEPLDPHRVVMRGTYGGTAVRCEQLRGQIGRDAHCGIYALRPSPCHALQPAWEQGAPSPQCDKARVAHGLAPLTPADWPAGAGAA